MHGVTACATKFAKEASMKKQFKLFAATAVLLYLLVGCQTTVPVTYTEAARMDLSGVNRIAVDSDNSQITSSVSQTLEGTGKYTVASEAELSDWKRWKAERRAMEELAAYQGSAAAVSSADLVRAYAGNAARADSSYLDKPLKVTSVVKEIEKSSRGSYFVRLEGSGTDSVNVFFAVSEIGGVVSLDKVQTVTVIGNCRGYNPPDMEDTGEILRLLGAGRAINIVNATFPVEGLPDYPGAVDAVITLKSDSSVQDSTRAEKRAATDSNGNTLKDAEGNTVYRDVAIYDRNVTVSLGYEVVRAREGSVIGTGTKSGKDSSSSEDASKLAASDTLVARAIRGALNEFTSEIIPTERSISITLAKESDNKEAKKEMSGAEKLAKAKNYKDAAAAYGAVYAKYKNFAAGYNQAVLTEASAGTEAAVELMEALVKATGNSTAQSELAGMQRRNASNKKAAAQLSK